ncbi:O-acetyl-ADP-ribose deacetylase [Halioglobus japonicus]|nr:O-acetyl-ADP-ribose deacetylase [Halioglobus japonicus]AQA17871.1 O-acetyl-ADP-ribose deacetylase [Halioglobus japonicus]GHD17747.1 macro domain-containing protein [Halioglobus japonicus]
MTVHLALGDITRAEVDAVVNAANEGMLGGGGVDGAIHRAAGPALLQACRDVPATNGVRCPTGEARITDAGALTARYVIHTVGPVYASATNPPALLSAAYRNSYQLALQHDCHSLAVPAISCGVYGYPLEEAAAIAVAVSTDAAFADLDIHFYLFSQPVYDAWRSALAHHQG